ncbi:MAG: 2-hydroxyacyl-CoA dehydratase [Lentisphaeria bacterium]|nr:2-hydroxyacyl-CoA dehydratase [Lentisphaeria bacterium]
MESFYLGIDIGSTTFKAVLMDGNGSVRHSVYQRTRPVSTDHALSCTGRCVDCGQCNHGALKKTVSDFLAAAGVERNAIACTVVTGSQIVEDTRKYLAYDFQVSEVSAHVAGALHFYPDCRAILDVGGQDSKAMIYNDSMQMWNSKMSGICAAGTGAFLDSVALKLNIPVEEMADKVEYESELEFSSVCAVLSATSINKFKNRYPIGQIIAGACRAQARTIISGVGELLFNYKGDIVFQGGVASNRAVAYYLEQITGNRILIPEYHRVMGAFGAACLAKQYAGLRGSLAHRKIDYATDIPLRSVAMRANSTRKEFFSRNNKAPTVWRNLFFPTEILNALGVRMLTMETYAALFARNSKRTKKALDIAAYKGFSGETCSFLRVLEGSELPKPDFGVSTSQPCQQGERIFQDLARQYDFTDRFYSLHTPVNMNDRNAVESIAAGLEESVALMEKALGLKLDMGKLAEACHYTNLAAEVSRQCNDLRWNSPPLIRGSEAIYNAILFSQLWGKKEMIDIQTQFKHELEERKAIMEKRYSIEDTHRILWLHLPPFYDTKILDYVEETCCAPIVFEEVNFVNWDVLNPDDPFRSLARKLLTVGFLDPALRVKYISTHAQQANLNGCILYNHGFGRCSLSDSCFMKHLREELKKIDLPLLILDGDCMDQTTDPCSTSTKISAFVESLNSKKYGNIFGPVL